MVVGKILVDQHTLWYQQPWHIQNHLNLFLSSTSEACLDPIYMPFSIELLSRDWILDICADEKLNRCN